MSWGARYCPPISVKEHDRRPEAVTKTLFGLMWLQTAGGWQVWAAYLRNLCGQQGGGRVPESGQKTVPPLHDDHVGRGQRMWLGHRGWELGAGGWGLGAWRGLMKCHQGTTLWEKSDAFQPWKTFFRQLFIAKRLTLPPSLMPAAGCVLEEI